ncbi:MAG: tRNA 5-methoxyuridine(34)/uridine 5-oxyacetic acid(34) synthase CmoB [Planctomycetota bacterium]
MLFRKRTDLIEQLSPNVDREEVQRLRIQADKMLEIEKFKVMAAALANLPDVGELPAPLQIDLSSAHVSIGQRKDLTDTQFEALKQIVNVLHPWRKGPFNLFGLEIDAEWRSDLKWERIAPALGDLRSRRILDVGCGNGYYMFRAAAQDPSVVLGLDPSIPFCVTFELIQRYLQLDHLQYDRLGCEHLYVFHKAFDVALCMGILYHHRSPIDILRGLLNSLRVGGIALIESQTIDGSGHTALFPEQRYAKARNVYFVPTKDCLVNWVRRAGFKDVEIVSHTRVTPDEQRRTEFMKFESLTDFLDPDDDSLTIEGYPGPWRTAVRAIRKF